jgi:hypothetical protein
MNPLARSHRALLYATAGILAATGIAWALLHYLAEERIAVPANALLMKVHGAAAMLALVLLGALLPHIAAGWRLLRNRRSGIALLALNGLMILTGYLLYYAGGEALRQGASVLHLALGTFLAAVLLAHSF